MKKTFILALVMLLALVVGGCGPKALPKPDTAQQAGVEALVAYGLAGHVAGQYLALPLCTSPLTVVPCKKQDIADRIKAADNAAYNAAVAADGAANDPAAQQKAAAELNDLKKANTAANGGKQ